MMTYPTMASMLRGGVHSQHASCSGRTAPAVCPVVHNRRCFSSRISPTVFHRRSVGNTSPLRAASDAGQLAAPASGVFSNIENAIVATFGAGGPGGDWEEVEGCWVLFPANGQPPTALVHFIGGAFVGAAPQLSYKLFLETLAARGVVVCACALGVVFPLTTCSRP